jgi:hypothetical protein
VVGNALQVVTSMEMTCLSDTYRAELSTHIVL